jgi:uncharacterized protein (DUF2252 family)
MKKKPERSPRPAERQAFLGALQRIKMARSVHAYVRGNTAKFYEWLAADGHVRPTGPPVWICGDCHVGNLGPLADAKGAVEIQIRDLDQTVIGNPADDLIRLGLSLAMAARGSDLPGVTTATMMEQMIEGYTQALAPGAEGHRRESKRPDSVRVVMRQAVDRTWKRLARERLEDVRPTIPLGSRFWRLSREERRAIGDLFRTEEVRRLATCLRTRENDAEIEVLDAAYWVKGCSSLGRLRFAVLLGIGEGHREEGGLCLMDIKEAVQAAAPRAPHADMPRDSLALVRTRSVGDDVHGDDRDLAYPCAMDRLGNGRVPDRAAANEVGERPYARGVLPRHGARLPDLVCGDRARRRHPRFCGLGRGRRRGPRGRHDCLRSRAGCCRISPIESIGLTGCERL